MDRQVDINEAVKEVMNGNQNVYCVYNEVSRSNFRWFNGSFDHIIRNPERYKFFIEEKKTFEKQFPSICLKIQKTPKEVSIYSAWTMENLLKDIQKHCIDKKVLKEEMKRISEAIKNGARSDFQLELMGKFQLFGDK